MGPAVLSNYFGTIPHAGLLRLVSRCVSDGGILELVKRFLKDPLVETFGGKRRILPSGRSTPQGGVISPLPAKLHHCTPCLLYPCRWRCELAH